MFGIARWVVRHKVGATAVVALGVFFMSPAKQEQQHSSNNPWAVQQVQAQASSSDAGSMVDGVMDSAVAYLDEAGINPMSDADEAVGRLDDTASAYARVNARNN